MTVRERKSVRRPGAWDILVDDRLAGLIYPYKSSSKPGRAWIAVRSDGVAAAKTFTVKQEAKGWVVAQLDSRKAG